VSTPRAAFVTALDVATGDLIPWTNPHRPAQFSTAGPEWALFGVNASATGATGLRLSKDVIISGISDRPIDSVEPEASLGHAFLVGVAPDGSQRWSRTIGHPDGRAHRFDSSFLMVREDWDGAIIAAGSATQLPGLEGLEPAAFITKMSSSGGAPAGCDDGAKDAGETGVDCGGPCRPCLPTCTNGIKDGPEDEVDCVVSLDRAFSYPEVLPANDQSFWLEQNAPLTTQRCENPCPCDETCDDGQQDCGETGVDCGRENSACGPCPPPPEPPPAGQKPFENNCSGCHGANGCGAGSGFVVGSGMAAPIAGYTCFGCFEAQVRGSLRMMPRFGTTQLNDSDLSAIFDYVSTNLADPSFVADKLGAEPCTTTAVKCVTPAPQQWFTTSLDGSSLPCRAVRAAARPRRLRPSHPSRYSPARSSPAPFAIRRSNVGARTIPDRPTPPQATT
jgi:hypothetical protein